jgi:hypothetical protein
LDFSTPRGGVPRCILALSILYLGMLEDAHGLRGLKDQKRVVKLGKLFLLLN